MSRKNIIDTALAEAVRLGRLVVDFDKSGNVVYKLAVKK